MQDIEFKNIEGDELEDFLGRVEESFGIEFHGRELYEVHTFNELSDHIKNKIELSHKDDCTSQQAFYKIRKVLSDCIELNKQTIETSTLISDIIPRKGRRKQIRRIENSLGFKINILSPTAFVIGIILLLFLASLVSFFFSWEYGLIGLLISIVGFRIAYALGIELELTTVGEIAEKMTRENYIQSRRDPNTYNPNEIENLLKDWFKRDFAVE